MCRSADAFRRTLCAEQRIKPEIKIHSIVDAIYEAVNFGKQIAFPYFRCTGRRQQKRENGGAEYVCSPWMLVWNGDDCQSARFS